MNAIAMRTYGLSRILLLLAVSGTAVPATGQDEKPPRRDAKKGDVAVFPLGSIGGRAEVLADQADARVLAVTAKAPGAAAGLAVGDRLIAAAGVPFPKHTRRLEDGGRGPMAHLGRAIEQAEGGNGRITLTIRRKGKIKKLTLVLPRRGRFAADYPANCPRSTAFHDAICKDLLATQHKDGSWHSRTGADATRYVTALCGLALLGRGEPEHLPALRRVARYLMGPDKRCYVAEDFRTPAGLSNWFICASGIFLAEYVLATGDEKPLPAIQHCCTCMAQRLSANGKFGHGITVGYSDRGFNVINTHAHLLWSLGARAGCKIDDKAWRLSLAEIKSSVGKNGGVRYWTSQTGYWDACARTGQMALALHIRGQEGELARHMADYLATNHQRMREAHAMGSIGMIFGTAALRRVNPEGWRSHMNSWRWYLTLMEQPGSGAAYIGGKRNNGGDYYLREEHVANAIAGVMLASGRKGLHMHGNDQRGWLVK